jgi:hypothetical protein
MSMSFTNRSASGIGLQTRRRRPVADVEKGIQKLGELVGE